MHYLPHSVLAPVVRAGAFYFHLYEITLSGNLEIHYNGAENDAVVPIGFNSGEYL